MDKLNSSLIANLIQEATEKVIENTNKFLETIMEKPLGADTIKVMMNGTETEINKSDYDEMKAQNDAIRAEMKEKVAAVVKEFKTSMKKTKVKKPEVKMEYPVDAEELLKDIEEE